MTALLPGTRGSPCCSPALARTLLVAPKHQLASVVCCVFSLPLINMKWVHLLALLLTINLNYQARCRFYPRCKNCTANTVSCIEHLIFIKIAHLVLGNSISAARYKMLAVCVTVSLDDEVTALCHVIAPCPHSSISWWPDSNDTLLPVTQSSPSHRTHKQWTVNTTPPLVSCLLSLSPGCWSLFFCCRSQTMGRILAWAQPLIWIWCADRFFR